MKVRADELFAAVMAGLVLVALVGCPAPTPTPTPRPTPHPVPTPTPCVCVVPDSEDPGWRGVPLDGMPVYNEARIRAARDIVGDRCGKPVDETYAMLAAQLQAAGACARGPWGDSVLVARPDEDTTGLPLWEEWKLVQANGCWSSLGAEALPLKIGGFREAWVHAAARSCTQ